MSLLDFLKKPKTETSNQPPPTSTKPTVLVVEDELYLRDFYQELLVSQGFNVITATNGQEGLDSALKNKPDVMLLDIMMPVMDGNQVMEKLRQTEAKYMPIIVLTNAGNLTNMDHAQNFSATKFLIKSNIAPPEIITAIKEALNSTPKK